jgi:hypothetical protein
MALLTNQGENTSPFSSTTPKDWAWNKTARDGGKSHQSQATLATT